MKTIYLAAGCFWGTQKFFDQFDGIVKTTAGYANGPTKDPSYEDVCADSGHAETVKIEFDETKITLAEILENYFLVIDPLSVNRQGGDIGIQYRTGIYYEDEALLSEIRPAVQKEEEKVGSPLAVEVLPLQNFYTAEEYHQKYLDKNPGGYCHISPALMHLNRKKA
ncbi:peptide-methionine (S)-S-oxide reductase [Lachnospiraceae bacterium NK3A20]|nr:peptide-methionine (S)-S-oxide reductase [Lachnospiraceae bacterium NK3A20]